MHRLLRLHQPLYAARYDLGALCASRRKSDPFEPATPYTASPYQFVRKWERRQQLEASGRDSMGDPLNGLAVRQSSRHLYTASH